MHFEDDLNDCNLLLREGVVKAAPLLCSIIKWFGGKGVGSESVFEVFYIPDE